MSGKILIIEDELRMRRVLELVLSSQGYKVACAEDGEQGIIKWKSFGPDLVFTDLKMPKATGLDVLKFGMAQYPNTPVIIFTAFGTIPAAVEAMKQGAFDYITKPIDNDILLEKAAQALKKAGLGKPGRPPDKDLLIGSSKVMIELKKELALVASTPTSVLITGASGTGKELAARSIHALSDRRDHPFVKINCAAIPKDLMESELFGHTKGAFTGAIQDRKGAFLNATTGTLFLDEIGDMPVELQSKLLHAVEDKVIIPLGSNNPVAVDVKIISATNQDLEQLILHKKFRSDLFYRLNSYTVRMPTLKERKEDIAELVDLFVRNVFHGLKMNAPAVDDDAIAQLRAHSWPGNVRELKNIVERLSLISRGAKMTTEMVQKVLIARQEYTTAEDKTKTDLVTREKELILNALAASAWNISKAARQLGITRNTLRYRIKKHGLKP